MGKVVLKEGVDQSEAIEELACALDLARFELLNPGSCNKEILFQLIKEAMDLCEEIEEATNA